MNGRSCKKNIRRGPSPSIDLIDITFSVAQRKVRSYVLNNVEGPFNKFFYRLAEKRNASFLPLRVSTK